MQETPALGNLDQEVAISMLKTEEHSILEGEIVGNFSINPFNKNL